ncbi:uncharacterized protein [Pyrus communis]|uniref:uncharacterized protein isoform X1 n=1 Tax=Pyrus communis TaxID=23211 RepID=UPI0035BF2024
MKMERRHESTHQIGGRWFLYLAKFSCGEGAFLYSGEVLEAVDPYIMDVRKEKFRKVVKNRSYGVCLVVEGLGDFGNVSAAFWSADALGFQSVHVVSCDSKRYRDNRHVSMGAEKWLDIEIWNSTAECFEVLKSRGYQIATTHLGTDAVIMHFLLLYNLFALKRCSTGLISSMYLSYSSILFFNVSIYDMNWCCPTAIVVGNENSCCRPSHAPCSL